MKLPVPPKGSSSSSSGRLAGWALPDDRGGALALAAGGGGVGDEAWVGGAICRSAY